MAGTVGGLRRLIFLIGCVALLIALVPRSSATWAQEEGDLPGTVPPVGDAPLREQDFRRAAPQGFGDRHNTTAWSMQWWQGNLYVGTGRSFECVISAIEVYYSLSPLSAYPPLDPEVDCTAYPQDLPLQAEIWRWTPETDAWDRVYRSPQDVEIPAFPDKYVAPDVGFRDMAVFTEPDGTEALYVGGFTSRDYNRGTPPPRLLRSTDGVTFAPVPQDPGTVLGDLDMLEGITISGFNRLAVHNGRLYVIAGGAYGDGVLLEATNPSLGNDAFRRVTPEGVTVTGAVSFNGFLYVATGGNPNPNTNPPFAIWKVDTSGEPPYRFQAVLTDGGYRPDYSTTVASLYVFDNALWLGTNRPTELYRIHADDSWDLIMGSERNTPSGIKKPLSGMGDGFNWNNNIHIHRMQEHEGWLYLGTNDQINRFPFRLFPQWEEEFAHHYGFDLYRTQDGIQFEPITLHAFEEKSYSYTARTFASTPHGLFLGTGNDHYGLQIWRGWRYPHSVYLPMVDSE